MISRLDPSPLAFVRTAGFAAAFAIFSTTCAGGASGRSNGSSGEADPPRTTQLTPELKPVVEGKLKELFYKNCDVKLIEPIDLHPPHVRRMTSFRTGDAWSETWRIGACGQSAVHHIDVALLAHPEGQGGFAPLITFTAAMKTDGKSIPQGAGRVAIGRPPMVTDAPSGSFAFGGLAAEAVLAAASYYPERCSVKIVKMLNQYPALGPISNPPRYQREQMWAETWLFDACGRHVSHHIDFFITEGRGQTIFITKVLPPFTN